MGLGFRFQGVLYRRAPWSLRGVSRREAEFGRFKNAGFRVSEFFEGGSVFLGLLGFQRFSEVVQYF